jgi:hypothetical protein
MIQRRIIFLLLSAFLAISALPTAAQTPVASFPPDAQDLAGIQAAVYRDYVPPDMFIGSQSVVFEATPMTEEDLIANRVSSIGVFVYELDNADNSAVAFERLSNGLAGSLVGMSGGTSSEELTTEELSGIGTRATLSRLVISDESNGTTSETVFEYVTVQRDEYVLVVTVRSNRGPYEGSLPDIADLPSAAIDLATELATNGQASDEPATFSEDGTSTGGLWGFMPAEGDPLLFGLTPFMDMVMYPIPAQ